MKLYIEENNNEYSNNTEENSEGVVNIKVPNLFEYNEYELESLIDWCNDYLSGYGLDAYVQKITTSNGLDVFYEIEDLEYSSHEEVIDTINQAVTDFFANIADSEDTITLHIADLAEFDEDDIDRLYSYLDKHLNKYNLDTHIQYIETDEDNEEITIDYKIDSIIPTSHKVIEDSISESTIAFFNGDYMKA